MLSGKILAAMDPEELFQSCLPDLERVVAAVCRRHGCYGADAEDFASQVKLKLIDDDYAVLRKFTGRSRLKTYLTTVVVNLFRDERIRKWGKWRPSAAAKRLGTPAIQLEEILYRDGRSLDEAAEILRRHFEVDLSRRALADLAARLPARSRPRVEGVEQLPEVAAPQATDDDLLSRERDEARRQAEDALATALDRLPDEDRLILRMRYEDGVTAAGIAQVLGEPQRRLYSRLDRLHHRLREVLVAKGVTREILAEVWGEA